MKAKLYRIYHCEIYFEDTYVEDKDGGYLSCQDIDGYI